MRKIYINPQGRQVPRPKSLILNNSTYVPPTDLQLEEAGYEIREIIDPVPEPPSKEELYKRRVIVLIRERYDADDEMALLRQRDVKQDEFATYNTYCEACKTQAHHEIYD